MLSDYMLKQPKDRLGYNGCEEIKEHPFFENIDWVKLNRKAVDAPYKPRVNGEYDLSNIDRVSPIPFHTVTRYSLVSQLKRRQTTVQNSLKT